MKLYARIMDDSGYILGEVNSGDLELRDNRVTMVAMDPRSPSPISGRLRVDLEIRDIDTLATLSARVRALEDRLP